MRFEHPELLYALLLLIIPIIVHLFRLRKFQKEEFTNVKFLKKVIQETRKSSRLKKFLILITRLLLLASIILAFSKPFIPATNITVKETRTFIYLDNSYSMQARDQNSSLFKKATDELLVGLNPDDTYSLLTNTGFYGSKTGKELKYILQEIQLSAKQLKASDVYLRASEHFRVSRNVQKDLVLISDFQTGFNFEKPKDGDFSLNLIQLQPENLYNIAIDTAYVRQEDPEKIQLNISVTSQLPTKEPVIISIYDAEKLLNRRSLTFNKQTEDITIDLKNELIPNGIISIEDKGLAYDDELFFNISNKEPVRVLAISEAENDFLQKIYTSPEFDLTIVSPEKLNFNKLNEADLLILNELRGLTPSLANNITNTIKNGSKLIIIPNLEASYSFVRFLNSLGFQNFQTYKNERLITDIVYDHPLFKDIFEDRTQNFDYPKTQNSFDHSNGYPVLKFQDNRPFLSVLGSNYLFSAPLNTNNSNFQFSPLIVPVFYQIGIESKMPQNLYYNTQTNNKIDISAQLPEDMVLQLENKNEKIIPPQRRYSNKVEITTEGISLNAGNYLVKSADNNFGTLSFNNSRVESNLEYSNPYHENIYPSVKNYFTSSNASREITELWKWFVIFALIFLGIEILLIKFLK